MRNSTRRLLAWTVGVALTAGGTIAWLVVPEAPRDARFSHADCRLLGLTDPRTGGPVVGVEDMALAGGGTTVVLSAHDRQDRARPDGGLYALSIDEIGGGRMALSRLDKTGGRFRPHGIAIDPGTNELAVINRAGAGGVRVEVGALGPQEWVPSRKVEDPRLCRANDLDFGPEGLRVTLDRADCETSFRDLVPWSTTGSVARLTPEGVVTEKTGLRFPNGISGDAVAETRAKAIRFDGDRRIDMPGGPDNLTRDRTGALVAAVHPGLFRLFLMRQGVLGRAGSRIVRLTGQGEGEILFDDPRGQLISGATVGLLVDGRLLIGSATDPGILVCEGGA